MKRHLFYTFLVIFVATATVTLLGITGVITISSGYLTALVTAFLVELAAAVIALFTRTDFYADDPKATETTKSRQSKEADITEERFPLGARSPNTSEEDRQDRTGAMIANVLKGYQDDTVYRQWKTHYRDELYSGLDVLPPNQALGLLGSRIDALLPELNAEISDMERRLQADPSEGDGNPLARLIDAYATKNKTRIRSALSDARHMIREQPSSGIPSRDLLLQIKGLF